MTEVNGNIEIIQPIGKINNVEVQGNTTTVSVNGVVETANVRGHLGIGLIERGTKDHSQLENLDYEHSGHTGFQPAGDYATNDRVDEVEAKIPELPENIVIDEDYVHTDNNFTTTEKNKLAGLSNGDIRIPSINVKCIVKDGEKYLRLVFGAYSSDFENYVKDNGIQIHLLRYKNCSRREWNEVIKTKEKKWMHPANTTIFDKPDKQCWGLACYQQFMEQEEYFDQIESADYYIANNGMVQSEYTLTYTDFKRGYLDINVRDLMSCIVKKGGAITPEDTDMKIPTYGDGELVKIMGTRTSPRRKRVRQPIKYVFALPVTTTSGKVKYQYGTSNEAILELMTLRDGQAMLSYSAGDKLLPDIGFGVLIK